MGYTNETTHYGIPLPLGSDLTTPMDYNTAAEAIDAAVFEAVSNSSGAVDTAAEAVQTANTANTTAAGAVTEAQTAHAVADSATTAAATAQNTANAAQVAANAAATTAAGAASDVNTLKALTTDVVTPVAGVTLSDPSNAVTKRGNVVTVEFSVVSGATTTDREKFAAVPEDCRPNATAYFNVVPPLSTGNYFYVDPEGDIRMRSAGTIPTNIYYVTYSV